MGEMPFFNWILYAYGISLISFLISGKKLQIEKEAVPSRYFYWLTRIFAFVLITWEIRHFFQKGNLQGNSATLWEISTYINFWFTLSFLFEYLFRKKASKDDHLASKIYIFLSILVFIIYALLILNPLFHYTNFGHYPLINGLLYIYLIPMIFIIFSAKYIFYDNLVFKRIFLGFAFFIGFIILSFQICHIYHPYDTASEKILDSENYTYSMFWILFAILTLIFGILKNSTMLRYGSLLVMIASIFKVFLYDIKALSDFYNFLSFRFRNFSYNYFHYLSEIPLLRC